MRCIHLAADCRCAIYTNPERPAVCASFQAAAEHCGATKEEALLLLGQLEQLTCGECVGGEGA